MRRVALLVVASGLACGTARAAEPGLRMHVVPLPVKSYRLLAMTRDDDGFVWAGSIHRTIHRYDPRTGAVEDVPLPYQATANTCLCVGRKVYVLGQTYPKLIVYDRVAKTFSEAAYPSDKPNVWYGTEAGDGRHLFLFDRASSGVVKWDVRTDTGRAIAYPYRTRFPGSGSLQAGDEALWCRVWDGTGKYVPLGLARLDLKTEAFTGFHPFPEADAELEPYGDPATTLFLPHTLQGRIVPFDVKSRQWRRPLPVPEHGTRFAFLGGAIPHAGRLYFSMSTYNGTDTGCDGKPYHFCNEILEFDPRTRRFAFLTLDVPGSYHQIAYMLSAGGEFFATGSNIREPDGRLNRDRQGEVVFWQTLRPEQGGGK